MVDRRSIPEAALSNRSMIQQTMTAVPRKLPFSSLNEPMEERRDYTVAHHPTADSGPKES
jgi:hypothetical protein